MRRALTHPAVLFLTSLVAFGLIHRLVPLSAGYSFETGMAMGAVIFIAAVLIGGSAIREMSRHATPIDPNERPSQLVTSGPFRFSRNPLYVALVLVLLAFAAMINSLWIAFGAVVLLLLLDRLVVSREEIMIADAFGPAFDTYRLRVRRWL